ncbi:MAG: hypothetical protein GMKNLPBB_03184 [Myxococcota bacterium]|nr:hypothetical protein [Myxococcota bacterium]
MGITSLVQQSINRVAGVRRTLSTAQGRLRSLLGKRERPLRVAVVGCGGRGHDVYCPMVRALSDHLQLAAVVSRGEASAMRASLRHGVPGYTSLEEMVERTKPDLAIVCVSYGQNTEVGLRAARLGMHLLLETPVAEDPEHASDIAQELDRHGRAAEVAEQNFRTPPEQIKRMLIEEGFFGRVIAAENDYRGHGYHGASMIRNYIGFDVPLKRVTGMVREFDVHPHYSRLRNIPDRKRERWELGWLDFEGGAIGIFKHTDISYDAPMLRFETSTRFYGENGMGSGNRLELVSADGREARPIRLEWVMRKVGKVDVTERIIAHTSPRIEWENPFTGCPFDDDRVGIATALMELVRCIREGDQPEYGIPNGCLDRAIELAIQKSSAMGSRPVFFETR